MMRAAEHAPRAGAATCPPSCPHTARTMRLCGPAHSCMRCMHPLAPDVLSNPSGAGVASSHPQFSLPSLLPSLTCPLLVLARVVFF